jgi:hypothetical protein
VLLALALTATACDLAELALNPRPRFEQDWNLPGPDTRLSVADLLPPGKVTILTGAAAATEGLTDSAAFSMVMDSTSFSAQLGPNCAACLPLNGTNSNKPAFTMLPGSSTALPANIDSAAILSGRIQVTLVNNLTFDPLFVNTAGGSPPQGILTIVVRSGSTVLGRDSIRGAINASVSQAGCASSPCNLPFGQGTTITRVIQLNTGTVKTNLTVDVTMNSPAGDHPVPIDVSKSFNASASVPAINVASVTMNVPSRTFDSGGKDSVEMAQKGESVVGVGLDMTFTNPFKTLSGSLNMVFAWGPTAGEQISKPITLPTGCATAPCVGTSSVLLSQAETQQLLTAPGKVSIKVTGGVSSSSPISVTPKLEVKIANRLRLKILTASGGT